MRLFLLAFAALALTASASAQDTSETASYGEYTLESGFQPDPLSLEVVAGGSHAVDVGDGCDYGMVADAPDLEITYTGEIGLDLYVYAVSMEDTTLLVNLPDGSWVCDDDSYDDGDPLIQLGAAPGGVYDIWVGTYGTDMVDATLMVSEIDPR